MQKSIIEKLISYLNINHWIIQRVTAISAFLTIFFSFFFNHFVFLTLLTVILCFHVFAGLSVLIDDYIHDSFLYFSIYGFIRLLLIFFLKSIFIVFI